MRLEEASLPCCTPCLWLCLWFRNSRRNPEKQAITLRNLQQRCNDTAVLSLHRCNGATTLNHDHSESDLLACKV
jgi:hypothetical protein